MNRILVGFVLMVFIVAFFEKMDLMDCFKRGITQGLQLIKGLLPNLLLMMFFVTILNESQLLENLLNLFHLGSLTNLLYIMIFRPLSNSASLGFLYQAYMQTNPQLLLMIFIHASIDTSLYVVMQYLGVNQEKMSKLLLFELILLHILVYFIVIVLYLFVFPIDLV